MARVFVDGTHRHARTGDQCERDPTFPFMVVAGNLLIDAAH
jgi:hypothetical protein